MWLFGYIIADRFGIYFYPGKRHPVEYEEEKFYDTENEIWAELERLLKREVELLVLNRGREHDKLVG